MSRHNTPICFNFSPRKVPSNAFTVLQVEYSHYSIPIGGCNASPRQGFVLLLFLVVDLTDEEDLDSVSLQFQKKRFYVDVKRNWRGRFMKIAEVY